MTVTPVEVGFLQCWRGCLFVACLLFAACVNAESDLADGYSRHMPFADYVRREVLVPMRDGVKLRTVILFKKGTEKGPILLSRTPYNAVGWSERSVSQRLSEVVPVADRSLVADGYIRVFQDIRGKDGSEGDYVVTRPLRGPLNRSLTDHSTDAFDTIEWLVSNIPESNGQVAITGSSYPGFLALMAMIDPHPALKAAIVMSPMIDGWMGDDWFHNGAFRQSSLDFLTWLTAGKGSGNTVPNNIADQYHDFLQTGSAGDYIDKWSLEEFPFIRKLREHPSYDSFWRQQAVDSLFAEQKIEVPLLLVAAQWDSEDSYGAAALYKALSANPRVEAPIHYVIGPWRHSGALHDGSRLGPIEFHGDTAEQYREDIQRPFLDKFLLGRARTPALAAANTYATGLNSWMARDEWPAGSPKAYYLNEEGTLSTTRPLRSGWEQYVSDPRNPVPYEPRPSSWRNFEAWHSWLVGDQRFADSRPDVISFVTPALTQPVEVAGQPVVDLFAATSGSDSDWVVKLIDVYPEEYGHKPKLAGYQLPIGIEIFRGRYVDSFENPTPLTPDSVESYSIRLPDVNHVFRRGHRIMLQVQSSLFPLYDRNPQTFVSNVFDAQSQDYRLATQKIFYGGDSQSAVWLPVFEVESESEQANYGE